MSEFLLSLPGELYASLLVMLIIAILAILMGYKLKKSDPLKAPKGVAFLGELLYSTISDFVNNNMGKNYEKMKPYLMTLTLILPLFFMAGLVGLPSPMTFYSIPLTFALITFVLIHINSIRHTKWKYFKRFVDPFPKFPIFLPVNILSTFAPIISLSFRMFGNALSGTIILELVYYFTSELSSKIASFNFMGPIFTPLLHAYFDLFSGVIQTMVFIYLTAFFIKGEEGEEEEETKALEKSHLEGGI